MEYPYDEVALKVEDQFMFGEELLVAPVLKKGERVKRLYLPEGEWIDFIDKNRLFGWTANCLSCIFKCDSHFVKKGSIVPMMPVMQYIQRKKDYPLLFIFSRTNEVNGEFELI